MDQATQTDIALGIAAFGAAGTVIRIIEFFRSRQHRLSAVIQGVQYGDELIIFNASTVTANIHYFSLDWARPSWVGRWFPLGRKIIAEEFSPEGEYSNITIEPMSQWRVDFSEQNTIAWHQHATDCLCLRLWVTGRAKPVWLWL